MRKFEGTLVFGFRLSPVLRLRQILHHTPVYLDRQLQFYVSLLGNQP
jgi:hypothetical protein